MKEFFRSWKAPFAGVVLWYVFLAGAYACSKRPWADEAWFANISYNMLQNHKTGISVLDPRGDANMLGREFPQINEHYYIWIPAQEAAYAVWYKIVGFHLLTMRAFSMLWGLGALGAWFVLVRKLTGSPLLAVLAIFLIASDMAFLDAASDGRMDIMCTALSTMALAFYVSWRDRRLYLAIAGSQCLVVAAGLTHPMGAIGCVVLFLLTVYLDRRRLGWRHAAVAALPYLAGAGVAAAYIVPGLDLFRAQLGTALTGRLGVAQSTGTTFVRELTEKYRQFYLPSYAPPLAYPRILIPLVYFLSLASVAVSGRLRSRTGYRTLLLIAICSLVTIAFLDSAKLYYYLVYSTPPLAVMLALWVFALWSGGGPARVLAIGCLVMTIALHLTWLARNVLRDPYHRSFVPMARFIQQKIDGHRNQPYIVTSSAELGFAIGFKPPLLDDALLGFGSRKLPNLFVIEERSYGSHYLGFKRLRPEVAEYISKLKEVAFQETYTDGYYHVYERKSQ